MATTPNSHQQQAQFQDHLPLMANKLGGDGLIDELCNGFNLLMDAEKGVITFDSLKRNAHFLGLQDLSDGALSQMEFCVLMFRLSPELMEGSKMWLEQVLEQEMKDFL